MTPLYNFSDNRATTRSRFGCSSSLPSAAFQAASDRSFASNPWRCPGLRESSPFGPQDDLAPKEAGPRPSAGRNQSWFRRVFSYGAGLCIVLL